MTQMSSDFPAQFFFSDFFKFSSKQLIYQETEIIVKIEQIKEEGREKISCNMKNDNARLDTKEQRTANLQILIPFKYFKFCILINSMHAIKIGEKQKLKSLKHYYS